MSDFNFLLCFLLALHHFSKSKMTYFCSVFISLVPLYFFPSSFGLDPSQQPSSLLKYLTLFAWGHVKPQAWGSGYSDLFSFIISFSLASFSISNWHSSTPSLPDHSRLSSLLCLIFSFIQLPLQPAVQIKSERYTWDKTCSKTL